MGLEDVAVVHEQARATLSACQHCPRYYRGMILVSQREDCFVNWANPVALTEVWTGSLTRNSLRLYQDREKLPTLIGNLSPFISGGGNGQKNNYNSLVALTNIFYKITIDIHMLLRFSQLEHYGVPSIQQPKSSRKLFKRMKKLKTRQ